MGWPPDAELGAMCPLPVGYRLESLRREQVPTLIEALLTWRPAIAVGAASKFNRADFYSTQAH